MFWYKEAKHTSVDVIGIKHKGRVRKNNEDNYLIITPDKGKNITETVLLLADGMGGYNKGEIASKVAIESFKDYFFKHKNEKKLANKVFDAIKYANDEVYNLSTNPTHTEYEGMGTTIAVLVIYTDYAVIGNVGDSRIYVLENDNLLQISEEHTYVNEIGLSPEQAKNHPDKNVITRSIGKKKNVKPYVTTMIVKESSTFLLCSDGLTTHVSDRFIRKILNSNQNLREKVNILLTEALRNGGTDNISIILATPKKIKQSALTKKKNNKKRNIARSKIIIVILVIIILILILFKTNNKINPGLWFSQEQTDTTKIKEDSNQHLLNNTDSVEKNKVQTKESNTKNDTESIGKKNKEHKIAH
jgi:protein phosphatase